MFPFAVIMAPLVLMVGFHFGMQRLLSCVFTILSVSQYKDISNILHLDYLPFTTEDLLYIICMIYIKKIRVLDV